MAYLSIRSLTARYGKRLVLDSLDLEMEQGEMLCLLGSSGCGKSTLLACLLGLIKPESGTITLEGVELGDLPPDRRHLGMVFQSYALFPNLNVAQNIAYGLASLDKKNQEKRVARLLDIVSLNGYEKRMPHELSGGEQQRVALARALAPEPKVLLLDEPLSALDAKVRESLGQSLRLLQKQLNVTAIFVTHDQNEAFALADSVAVMHNGRIEQVDTPENIYKYPATPFIARFIGAMNFLVLPGIEDECAIRYDDVQLQEATEFTIKKPDTFVGQVKFIQFYGNYWRVHLQLQDCATKIVADVNKRIGFGMGDVLAVTIPKAARRSWPSDESDLQAK